MKTRILRRSAGAIFIAVFAFILVSRLFPQNKTQEGAEELARIETRVQSLRPDPHFRDDRYILIAIQEALTAKREGSGGIGACLVNEATGEIVERGRNRQYAPYFRSDMHAEMDLINRFEDSLKILKGPGINPRQHQGLVLYSSVEPCPMCLTRIINAGFDKTYYAAPDPAGGMAHKINDLPPFWKEPTANRIYAAAQCSPEMSEIAARLFSLGPKKNPLTSGVNNEK